MLGLLRALVASAVALIAGCVTVHGPTSFTLSRDDIERGMEADLGNLVEIFRGLDLRRPEVALMPVAGRLELAWYLTVPTQGEANSLFASNVGVAVVMSGKPALNAGRSGVDLTDVRIDDVRMLGLPRVLGFGLGRLADRKGAASRRRRCGVPTWPTVPPRSRSRTAACGSTSSRASRCAGVCTGAGVSVAQGRASRRRARPAA
jgi:hypothetical protein